MARRSSDSALLTHSSSSRIRQLEDSPHRTRATQMGHSETRTQIAEAAQKIGKGTILLYSVVVLVCLNTYTTAQFCTLLNLLSSPAVSEWSTDDVCEWLKEIGLEEYRDNVRSHDVGGAELLTMKTSDISVSLV